MTIEVSPKVWCAIADLVGFQPDITADEAILSHITHMHARLARLSNALKANKTAQRREKLLSDLEVALQRLKNAQ